MSQEAPDTIDVRTFFAVLRRQAVVVVAVVLAVLALLVVATALQSPSYISTVRVAVQPPAERDELERILFGTADVPTQAQIVRSASIIRDVLRDQGLPFGPQEVAGFVDDQLQVEALIGTTVIEISVTAPKAVGAAALAQAIAEEYLEFTAADARARVVRATTELDTRAQARRVELRALEAQLRDGSMTTRASLEQERDELQAELRSLATRRAELQTATAFERQGRIVTPAVTPTRASSPKPVLNLALGLVLGSILGVVVAFVRDVSHGRVRDADAVEALGMGPVLARVPRGRPEPVVAVEPGSPASEEYRRLRGHVLRLRGTTDQGLALALLPAGSTGDAGRAAANLALALVGSGRRVLLVDADDRGGAASSVLGLASPAFKSWSDVRAQRHMSGLLVLDTRALPVAGPGSLARVEFERFLREQSAHMDDLLIVVPPPEVSASYVDAFVHCRQALVVVHAGVTGRAEARLCRDMLLRLDLAPLGVVVDEGRRKMAGRPVAPVPLAAVSEAHANASS